jgi:FtsZ-interacting cell division protein YlmF
MTSIVIQRADNARRVIEYVDGLVSIMSATV